MTTEQKQVREFMQLFGQETPEKPSIPSREIRRLRAKLILEEAQELCEALGFEVELDMYEGSEDNLYEYGNPNLSLIADGLADLHYVAYCGTAIACGLDMKPIFQEVHRSNMSKMWTVDEYEKSMDIGLSFTFCWDNDPTNSPMQDDRCWLAKNKDGKVIKSPSYSPANIQAEIDKQLL